MKEKIEVGLPAVAGKYLEICRVEAKEGGVSGAKRYNSIEPTFNNDHFL